MTEAAAKLSPWLLPGEAVAGVARHLGCAPEAAELRIVSEGKGGRVKARGAIETRPVSLRIVGEGKGGRIKTCGAIEIRLVPLLPAAWNGTVDLAGATMKPPEVTYKITNLELCFIDLVAAGLLPAPAKKTWWPAAEAIAYLVRGVSLPWEAWQGAGASPAEIEQAEIDLGEAIRAGVPARGRPGSFAQKQPIPADSFHPDMIENKTLPVSVARPPKVVVDCAGCVTTAPRQRSADYQGPRWQAIEVDAAALRRARPRSADPKLAKAKHPRWQRARIITELKSLYPPHGSHPNGTSIAALTKRINNRPNFKDDKVSEDSVERAASEIKAEIKAAREK